MENSKWKLNNGKKLTGKRIRFATRHLEIQFAITKAGVKILGVRDCTAQDGSQKVHEDSYNQGDYPPALMEKILQASNEVINRLSESDIGYIGLGTLEMLVIPHEDPKQAKVAFLEVNARLQVEHMVTEWVVTEAVSKGDDTEKGRRLSLPILNYLCVKYPDKSPGDLIEQAFNITSSQLAHTLINPASADNRISHLRLNSKKTCMTHGVSIPSYLYKYMWASGEVLENIAKQTNTDLIQGDIGAGKYDSQAGALCGRRQDVIKAAQMVMDWVETARTYFGSNGTLSLPFVLAIDPIMYDEKNNFSPNFCTTDIDFFLEAIRKGDIELDFDLKHPSITPQLKEGAMASAYAQYLKLQKQQAQFSPVQMVM